VEVVGVAVGEAVRPVGVGKEMSPENETVMDHGRQQNVVDLHRSRPKEVVLHHGRGAEGTPRT
jgi:hypothetical protein